MMKKRYLLASLTGLLVACGGNEEKNEEQTVETPSLMSIDVSLMDTTIRPQYDFFMFANGTWVNTTEIPASESRWGSFNELDQSNNEKLTEILDNAASADAEKGSPEQLVGDYYSSYMNLEQRNEAALPFLTARMEELKNVSSKDALVAYLTEIYPLGISTFFSFGVGQDLKDVDNHTVYFSQSGLGLPNKNYYFDETKEDIRTKYVAFIAQLLTMAGEEDAEERAAKIFEFEKTLAEKMMKPEELRVPENRYNKYATTDLIKELKPIGFKSYIETVGIDAFDTIIVGQPAYVNHLAKTFKKADLALLKDYQLWKLINHYAGHLNEEFVQANFDFYKGVLSGTKEMKPINERAIKEITRQPIGQALGRLFVAEHFSPEAKDKINSMVDGLMDVYRDRIKALDWMSDVTKGEALIKLEAFGRKLGYPEQWKDLSELNLSSDNYLENIDACERFQTSENLAKLNNPVDKDEWGMPPHMVNAYYHPLLNEIAFPAGIMQYPFFDVNAEDAVNYGGIGMVIGHEFTHGFDDMGSKFAADGSFTNWWTEEDRSRFEERTSKLGQTYESFCPIHEHCVNPNLTMGENIADLGGITMAYHAYKKTDEYQSGELVNGFTPSQRFFIAYAQLWKIKYTDEELKKRIATDPHSPGMFRVNGPLMNAPEFFEAFDVQEGDPMRNSEETISRIW